MISAEHWIERLRSHLPIARAGVEVEGVHQVRVASRRLDAWLRLGTRRMLRDDLRWLRGVVGPARDLDVLIAGDLRGLPLPEPLLAWMRRRRADEQARIVAALGSERAAALVEALQCLPDIDGKKARRRVAALRDQTLRRGAAVDWKRAPDCGAPIADRAADADRIHALRRSVRRLRFGLEWLGSTEHPLAALQDLLGEFNNNVVMLRCLDAYGDPEAEADLRAALEAGLVEMRGAIAAAWISGRREIRDLGRRWN